MLVVFTHSITNRVNYIFDLLLNEILGVEYFITTSKDEFAHISTAKFNYSDLQIKDELFIQSTDLLFETNIRPQQLTISHFEGLKVFYQTSNTSAIPFDLFAACFFLVSRYEEYLSFNPDKYGRFEASESFSFQNNFLEIPVVNQYALFLKNKLKSRFPELIFKETGFQHIHTVDVDNAYAYLSKGIVRTTGALMRSLINLDFRDLRARIKSLTGNANDPFDTFNYLRQFQQQKNLKSIYFFLMGNLSQHDRNVSFKDQRFQKLIKTISGYADIGIHPSFLSNIESEKVGMEKNRLVKVLSKQITKSRQHFLKMKFPDTYRNLILNGITDDYSMGYAQQIGFRAGICTSFYFYDLQKEERTNLRIHPFAVMDATLNFYMKLSTAEAIQQIIKIKEEVKKVNGTFITLWHNETVSETGAWKGWREVFEKQFS